MKIFFKFQTWTFPLTTERSINSSTRKVACMIALLEYLILTAFVFFILDKTKDYYKTTLPTLQEWDFRLHSYRRQKRRSTQWYLLFRGIVSPKAKVMLVYYAVVSLSMSTHAVKFVHTNSMLISSDKLWWRQAKFSERQLERYCRWQIENQVFNSKANFC